VSNLNLRKITGKDGQPVQFPTGIVIGSGALGGINNIGIAGQAGFGVGVCPGPLPAGMGGLSDYQNPLADAYGNYQYSDGSVMVWIPAFYYKWGTGANGVTLNQVAIQPFSAYVDVATANAAGYALHRAFYDGGAIQAGFFVDKYVPSRNGGIASSLKNGIPLASALRGGIANTNFASLTGAPIDAYYGAIAAAKTRGANFFCSSRFIRAALALLAYAHGQASSTTTYCAWYHAVNNFPKGCNNNALGDAQDAAILYLNDGTATNCGKTGSANLFSRTTHNGQNSGVADLNGLIYNIDLGLVSETAATHYYVLKTSARMKDMTAGVGGALDLWGTAGQLAANYDDLGATYGAALASASLKLYGNAAQVFSEATSGLAWQWTGVGGPLVGGVGGTNPFGNDAFYDYRVADMCPLSGGYWNASSSAGVWDFSLYDVRGNAAYSVGFRAALYL